MDYQACKDYVEANAERLIRLFGIPHWHVDIEYAPLAEAAADCSANFRYERALIRIDWTKIPDEALLEKILKHELLHILHSPYDLIYEMMREMLTNQQWEAFKEPYATACELTVKNLERLVAAHAMKEAKPDELHA